MELPNNTHNSEAAKQMEFAEGFNPELTTEEKLQAAAEFDDLVQSTLLRFAEDVITDDSNMAGCHSLDLVLSQKDGSEVSVGVHSSESLDDGSKSRGISLEERGTGEYHWYYIEDGLVLRYDDNTSSYLGRGDGIEDVADIMNSKLEQNRQPVGVDEMHKLAELLESAKPV